MKKLRWIGLPVAAVLVLVIVLLPMGIRLYAESWLADQGVENPVIGDVDLNLFTGFLRVEELSIGAGSDQDGVLRLAETNFEWTGLFRKQVSLKDTWVSGGRFDVRRLADGGTLVGDLRLPLDNASAEQPPQADAPSENGWGFALRNIHVEDLAIRYRDTSFDSVLNIENADFDRLDSLDPAQSSLLTADLRLDDTSIELRAEGTPLDAEPKMDADLRVSELQLQRYAPQLEALGLENPGGTLGLELSAKLQALADQVFTADAEVQFDAEDLAGTRGITTLVSDSLNWGAEFQAEYSAGLDIPLQATGTSSLHMAGLAVRHRDKPISVLALDELAVEDAALDPSGELRLDSVLLTGLGLVQHDEDTDPTAQIARVSLEDISVRATPMLDIGRVALDSTIIRIQRQPDGKLRLVSELIDDFNAQQNDAESSPDVSADPVAEDAEQPAFRINEFVVDDSSHITINDASVEPAFATRLNIKEFRLTGISSIDPETPAHLVLEIEQDDSATVTGNGQLTLFAETRSVDVKLGLKNLDLTQVSNYMPGYHVQRGRLSVDSQAKMDGDTLNIANDVQLEKLKLSAKAAGEKDIIGEGMAMPLDVALDLLRDGDDIIRFELPVSGSLDDPKFGTGDVLRLAMQTAMQKAAMRYVKNALQPLGTILFVAKVAGKASRPRFEPVEFTAGQTTLTSQAGAYLDKIAKMLAERPKLSITLCGIATPEDAAFMLAQTAPPAGTSGVVSENSQTSPAPAESPTFEVEQMDLAKARGAAVQAHLETEHAVETDRLFRCRPRIEDEAGDGPRVEITL